MKYKFLGLVIVFVASCAGVLNTYSKGTIYFGLAVSGATIFFMLLVLFLKSNSLKNIFKS